MSNGVGLGLGVDFGFADCVGFDVGWVVFVDFGFALISLVTGTGLSAVFSYKV